MLSSGPDEIELQCPGCWYTNKRFAFEDLVENLLRPVSLSAKIHYFADAMTTRATKLQPLQAGLNAYTLTFDHSLLEPVREMYNASLDARLNREGYAYLYEGMEQINFQITDEHLQYHVTSYGTAPLVWVSCNNDYTFSVFRAFFDALAIDDDLKPLVDHEKTIRMYCGFFVIGKQMDRLTWHKDYHDNANGYTLITPLFELDPAHGNLLYKNDQGEVQTYRYKTGEAIIFGDGFEHATEPYPRNNHLRIMLSLTFGTDKLAHWDTLKKTIGEQSNYMILPCGHRKGDCDCV